MDKNRQAFVELCDLVEPMQNVYRNISHTVKTGNAYTLLVGRVVAGLWVVCGLSKGSPHEGY